MNRVGEEREGGKTRPPEAVESTFGTPKRRCVAARNLNTDVGLPRDGGEQEGGPSRAEGLVGREAHEIRENADPMW